MKPRIFIALIPLTFLSAALHANEDPMPPKQISLSDCEIWIAPNQPNYVMSALQVLRDVIEAYTGNRPRMRTEETLEGHHFTAGATILFIIRQGVDEGADAAIEGDGFGLVAGTENVENRKPLILVWAANPHGYATAIMYLIRNLTIKPDEVTFQFPFDTSEIPRFKTRSLYAHLHWSYNNPYALRSWSLDDWKRYVHLLRYLGFNNIQMWPMMELLPHPLSDADRTYLEKYRTVVDYAHEQCGMGAFVGSCPNNITTDARGVPIEKREYFDFEQLLDPGVPENLATILEYRSDLYKTVPNADGYWVIDGDPGGWKGSPTSEFVDILLGHRKLLDEFGQRPSEQFIIYWMWDGWGTGTRPENWRAAAEGIKDRFKGPWRVHLCNKHQLDVGRAASVLDRAIYYPYNLIEDEPSGPLTDIRFDRIQQSLDLGAGYGVTAAQGNAQTPLVQLPNIYAFSLACWKDADVAKDQDRILQELADQFLCKDADKLAAAWKSLTKKDPAESLRLANQMKRLAADDSARGRIHVVIGDWQQQVLEDLAAILPIHAYAIQFADQVDQKADTDTLCTTFAQFLAAAATWMEHTGYHNRRIIIDEAYREPIVRAFSYLRSRIGEGALYEEIIRPAREATFDKVENDDLVHHIANNVLGRGP